jgi:hypothetical protein
MVIPAPSTRRRHACHASLISELVVALAIMATAVIPISFSYVADQKLLRASYYRALALEIVDGEMEVLTAGEWKTFPPGTQPYLVRTPVATNLPPGKFLLTVERGRLRLEWTPLDKRSGGKVIREVPLLKPGQP